MSNPGNPVCNGINVIHTTMRKLTVYNFITLDGYFKGPNGDLSWHHHGGEESEFASDSAGQGNTLVFGRVTYDMMASYWPTPMAIEQNKSIAEGMNRSEKIVFSQTLKKASWENTTIIRGDAVAEMKKLKKTEGSDMTILGSGSIISLFAAHGLVDAYQFMLDPVAIGKGTSIFTGISRKLDLKLTHSKVFKSGVILLGYEPMKA